MKERKNPISTKEYLLSQDVHLMTALTVQQMREDVFKKRIHNHLRMLFTFLFIFSLLPWSSNINVGENIQYVLAIALGTDLCGTQFMNK